MQACLEGSGEVITRQLVQSLIKDFISAASASATTAGKEGKMVGERLAIAGDILEEVVTKREFPEFLTTYLNQDHTFRAHQKRLSV